MLELAELLTDENYEYRLEYDCPQFEITIENPVHDMYVHAQNTPGGKIYIWETDDTLGKRFPNAKVAFSEIEHLVTTYNTKRKLSDLRNAIGHAVLKLETVIKEYSKIIEDDDESPAARMMAEAYRHDQCLEDMTQDFRVWREEMK